MEGTADIPGGHCYKKLTFGIDPRQRAGKLMNDRVTCCKAMFEKS